MTTGGARRGGRGRARRIHVPARPRGGLTPREADRLREVILDELSRRPPVVGVVGVSDLIARVAQWWRDFWSRLPA
ncbi:hypothetical protein PYR91_02100 (plasmid) [Sphaerisporangium sp. TRM90804]|nr:hypothetical protein [Sphaerisporangium sp. TRM90804]